MTCHDVLHFYCFGPQEFEKNRFSCIFYNACAKVGKKHVFFPNLKILNLKTNKLS
jgi:hypothetical protein